MRESREGGGWKPPQTPFDQYDSRHEPPSYVAVGSDDILCSVDQMAFPFKRLAIMEEVAAKLSVDYDSTFLGPKLDSLECEMVNSGQPNPGARSGQSDASSGRDSGTDRDSAAFSPSPSTGGRRDRKSWLRGPWKQKKKPKQSPGWDLFPGIVSTEWPTSSNETVEQKKSDTLAHLPAFSAPVELHRASVGAAHKEHRPGWDDALARTFDVPEIEAAGLWSSSALRDEVTDAESGLTPGLTPENTSDEEHQCTVGGKALMSVDFQEGSSETSSDTMKSHSSLNVKDTCIVHLQKYKELLFVNEYAIITTLGRGSFGEVKLALNTHDMTAYALKLIAKSRRRVPARTQDSRHIAEASVMSEINLMKELSHPNLVRLVEVIDDPTNHKILMVLEYVEGGCLFAGTRISPKKRLSELQARKYFRDVLQGLSYLHANKIAHGDLKPDNFLLAINGHVKIADFGSSQLTRVGGFVKRTAGTPAFMAPEMCGGQPYQARLADVWALGVSLYMFVFGTVPFKSSSILGLYDEICKAPLVFPAEIHVSDSFKHLLSRMLDKDPERRISLSAVMKHPWVTYNEELPLLPTDAEVELAEDLTPSEQVVQQDDFNVASVDLEGHLMESWPDSASDSILASAMRAMFPFGFAQLYPDGSFLVAPDEPFQGIFQIEAGSAELMHLISEADSDEEEERHAREEMPKPHMMKLILDASVKASQLVQGSRHYHSGQARLLSHRGPGCLIGEIWELQRGKPGKDCAVFQHHSVMAKGGCRATFVPFWKIREVMEKWPELDADLRAVLAQLNGELLTAGMLELLAGFRTELEQYKHGSSPAR